MATLNNDLEVKVKAIFTTNLSLWDAIKLRISGKKYYEYFIKRIKKIEKKTKCL